MWFPPEANEPEVLVPRKQSFDLPALPIAAERSSILCFSPLLPVWSNRLDASLAQPFLWIAIVGLVADHGSGQGGDATPVEHGLDQRGFIRQNARSPDVDRNTAVVCDCHDLAPFAAACWTNAIAPLFAPLNEASTRLWLRFCFPRSTRSSHRADEKESSTPERCHG